MSQSLAQLLSNLKPTKATTTETQPSLPLTTSKMLGVGSKSNVFFDCETHRITREVPVPPLVCLQFARDNDQPSLLGGTQEGKDQARAAFQSWLADPDTVLVAHNGFFDATRMLDLEGYWLPDNRDAVRHEKAILLWMNLCLSGRYRDTLVMSKLNSIEFDWMGFDRKMWKKTEYNLAYLVKRFTGAGMFGKSGEDTWRLNYHLLDGKDPSTWPFEATDYALGDITHLRNLFNVLDKNTYPDEAFQTAAFWVFRLMELWGLHTSRDRVEYLKSRVLPFIEKANSILIDQGLMRPGEWKTNTEKFEAYLVALCQAKGIEVPRTPTGKVAKTAKFLTSLGSPLLFDKRAWQEQQPPTRDMHKIKSAVVEWYSARGLDVPLVEKKRSDQDEVDYFVGDPDEDVEIDPTEGVSTDRDCLASTDHPGLKVLAEVGKLKTLANNFIPKMETGYQHPLRAFWNGLVVTGRPSCGAGDYGTNFLNQPKEIREGEHGVRECYQARPGYVFIDGDAQQAELCGFAQICHDKFGYSIMGDIINSGKDLHSWFGAILAGSTYDAINNGYLNKDPGCTKWRNMAKPCNFGFLGGLGAKKFVKWARKQYKVNFTEAQVKEYKKIWLREFPEAQEYFNWVNTQLEASSDGRFTFIQHRSNRARGGCGFCDGSNTGFQGIIADAVKQAMISIFIACHTPGDDLYGCRIPLQIYDELLIEAPIATASRAAVRFVQLFQEGMNQYLPDVPAKVTCEMMFNWSKLAKAVFNSSNRMVPFDISKEAQEAF